ncbi:MAG: thiamine-phosphate kinase [Verrucomicrobiota bacterium]
MKLHALGEDRLLAQLLPKLASRKNIIAGAGDDCAVVAAPGGDNLLLLKTDCVVEGVHFETSADAVAIGWKALARPLSDFAAMAGVPQFALVTMIARSVREVEWVKKIYRGLQRAADKFDVAIVGGEMSGTSGPAVISVSVTGFVEKRRWVSRAGGKSDDELFVTGRLGGSRSGRHLQFIPRIKEARWLTRHFPIHAMIDLSDGLGVDLPRLTRASKMGFEVDEDALPRTRGCTIEQAISDGEDYELLFAISSARSATLQRKWRKRFPRLPLTRIGRLNPKFKIQDPKWSGYVHFAERR